MAMYSANAPSRSTPMMRVFLQMWLLPVRHWRQCPQTIWPSAVTSCPVRSSATPPPTATISPANSCPTTRGGLRRPSAHAFQSAMCRSVPHTPACRTAIKTSPGPGDGLGTVVTLRPGARRSLTIACIETRDARCEMRDALEDRPREAAVDLRSEEHTSELQSQSNLVCRLLLEKKKKKQETLATRRLQMDITKSLTSHGTAATDVCCG